MARPKPPEVKKGLDEWMGTYGDLITLMLCFFVMLYSMSNLDTAKFTALQESYAGRPVLIQGNLGGIIGDESIGLMPEYNAQEASETETESDKQAAAEARAKQEKIEAMASDFKTYLAQDNATSRIEIEETAEYVLIRFPDGVLFDSGKAVLKTDALNTLEVVADLLLKYPNHRIRVEGHTDTIPINTAQYPSNFHLSSARASTVVEYLINVKDFNPMDLSPEGMSEYYPVDTNDTAAGRANNRRVEIKVYAEQSDNALSIPMD